MNEYFADGNPDKSALVLSQRGRSDHEDYSLRGTHSTTGGVRVFEKLVIEMRCEVYALQGLGP